MLYNTERPLIFDNFRGQKYIVESLRAQAINQKFFGVYIFGGYFGCGKTSMARTLTRAANCEHPDENGNPCLVCKNCRAIISGSPDIMEIDAATNTGVDSIRELRENVNFKPVELRRKFYIIDEVHMLSKGAFNALLKVLEEPPEHVTFILCTTEIGAIPATIRSRGACYFFERLTCDELATHVEEVARKNSITLLDNAADMIAKYSQGAARNALSILDQVSSMNSAVSAEMVQRLLGVSDNAELFCFAKKLLEADTMGAVSIVEELASKGKDFELLCDDLIEIVTDTILYSIGGKDVVRNTEQYVAKIDELVSVSGSDRLCVLADHLHSLKGELRVSPEKATVLAAVIRLTMDTNNSIIALTDRISSLEKELAELKASGLTLAAPLVNDSVLEEPVLYESTPDEINKESFQQETEHMLAESVMTEDIAECTYVVREAEVTEHVYEGAAASLDQNELDVPFIEEPVSGTRAEGSDETEGCGSSGTKSDEDDFDIFDIFDLDFSSEDSVSMQVVEEKCSVESTKSKISSEEMKETVMLVKRIAVEQVIFATALKGCTISEREDGLHIDTELSKVRTLVEFYRSHYESNGFEVARNIIV